MKTRIGFVSNSSSASFVVWYKDITPVQLQAIKDLCKPRETCTPNLEMFLLPTKWDLWTVMFFDDQIVGDTLMDNGELKPVFLSLGIPGSAVHWEDDNDIDWEAFEDSEI